MWFGIASGHQQETNVQRTQSNHSNSNFSPPNLAQAPKMANHEPPEPQVKLVQQAASDSNLTPASASTTSPPPINISTISSSTSSSSSRPEKISFYFKTSIFTHRVTIETDKMDLGSIKELAMAFLDQLYFQQQQQPSNCYMSEYIRKHFTGDNPAKSRQLYERLVLRKYLIDEESFVPFNSVSDIEPDSYISIELSEKQPPHSNSSNSVTSLNRVKIAHEFKPESFYFITLCYSCNTVIKGVFRQGFKCQFCNKNFCPKCKVKAEAAGDSCLSSAVQSSNGPPTSPQPSNQQHQQQVSSDTSQSGGDDSNHSSVGTEITAPSAKLDMSKRKSTSNLLHFNLANPFKSHHSPHAQQQTNNNNNHHQQTQNQPTTSKPASDDQSAKGKSRNSAGALDPILQQLSKNRAESQQQQQHQHQLPQIQSPTTPKDKSSCGNSLQVAQATHLSISHQNLFTNGEEDGKTNGIDGEPTASAGTLSQTSSGSRKNHSINQLSNSARTSAHDLYANSPIAATAASRSRDNQVINHAFICMDWIQINGEPLCGVCNKVLRQQHQPQSAPSMCKNCKLQVHAQCQNLVLVDCLSRIAANSRAAADSDKEPATELTSPSSKDALKNTNSNVSRDNIRLHRLAPSVKHVKRPDLTKPIIEGWLKHTTLADEQARQHYWRLDETDITLYENDTSTRYFKAIALSKITRVMSAHSLPKRVREDVLTSGQLQTQTSGSGKARSANTSPVKSPELLAQMKAMFAFELTTGSMYLVQANDETEASRWRESLANITSQKKKAQEVNEESEKKKEEVQLIDLTAQVTECPSTDAKAIDAETAQSSPQTVTKLVESINNLTLDKNANAQQATSNNQNAAEPLSTAKVPTKEQEKVQAPPPPSAHRHHQHHHYPPSRHHQKVANYTDHQNRSRLYNRPRKTIKLDPMRVPDHWIEGKYLIEPDRTTGKGFEELGSGQFGKVYAAISEWKAEDASRGFWSGVPVAIKEISKTRFDLRQQAKLKNEANILSRLDHPGVIILERVHDLPDKIYIVMEQLEDDMLEMIVSTEEKRLNERVTKFLTYQILEALRYLHAQNIAHCDLKPENVLLVERRSQFPQIKLCDFGFAKIIEDNSFRSSLVGTPAYLAPEVVKGERYNRSVDLWSVGVIVYVSLSGEFPFNEGENIHEQISRANFANYMYPEQPWGKISSKAKNFINSLLNVNCEKRKSARQAQMHEWIQDFQCWCDLSELELRVGKRWVTDDADYDHWSRYAKEHHLQIPRSAIQLHEELNAD